MKKNKIIVALCSMAVIGIVGSFTASAESSSDHFVSENVVISADEQYTAVPEAVLMKTKYAYTGNAILPVPEIRCGDTLLTDGIDYDLSYRNNTYVGTGYVIVTYKGDYSGSETLSFKIVKRDISNIIVSLGANSFYYSGSPCKPSVTLKLSSLSLRSTRDYIVKYTDNVNVGTASVTVTGIGNCFGSVTKTFTINPQKVKFKSYTKTTNSITLNWNTNSSVTGYRIYRYAGGSTWVPAKTISDSSKGSYTVCGLSAGTEYRFRVRAYTVIDDKTYWGEYSDILICKTTPSAPAAPTISDSFFCGTNSITINWNTIQSADGYYVYRYDGSAWKNIKSIKGNDINTFKDTGLESNSTYRYQLKAYIKDGSGVVVSKASNSKSFSTKSTDTLYYTKYATNVYTKNYAYVSTLSAGGYYTGYYNPHYPNYYVINYKSNEYLVSKSNVTIMNNAKVLKTGAIGQYGGSIAGYSACGPTAAAILVNSQLNENWNKDDLIRYCENHWLNDQGSLRSGGGITAPNLIKLINQYSGGAYTAENIYGSNPTGILKNQIDSGKRAIVVVQYTSYIVTHYNSGTHFVVICGYEYINGSLYFYYADPYYGNGARSLNRISASVLGTSMSMVIREPRCIITVDKS